MIPENVEDFHTEGERRFYRFIETVALPHDQYICWYTPDIKGNRPDFLLFSKKLGLIVFEVKDWCLDQIISANPKTFELLANNKRSRLKNPYDQARSYVYNVLDLIKNDGRLISKDPEHRGNSKVPIECGVVFPNINKFEYNEKGLDSIIDPAKAFFWGDLHLQSDYCSDHTGACLAEALEAKFPPRFSFSITNNEFQHLKHLIFPSIRLSLPERDSDFPYKERLCRLNSLDHQQEVLARKFDGGHRIITGPSGSGKTLVLAHKARFLLKYNPRIKTILFVCFNITLVNYLKRLLANIEVPMGSNGVKVCHFYELCSEVIQAPVAFEKKETAYYDLVEEETLSRLKNYDKQFDAILVDEGQDYSDRMLKIIMSFLNPKTNNLTIVVDERQELYQRQSCWENAGIKARGRVHRLQHVYRSTEELTDFAARFEKQLSMPEKKSLNQLQLFPHFTKFYGPAPVIKQLTDFDGIINYVAECIKMIVKKDECPYSEIAVIYTKKKFKDKSTQFIPVKLAEVLNAHGIICNWASKDFTSKSNYDITTNSVAISTIHSAKGFDYAYVFVVGLDLLEANGWTRRQIDNLTYVAITRARYQLFIPYVDRNEVISILMGCL